MKNESHNHRHSVAIDSRIQRIIEEALHEDVGMGDLTTEAIVSEGEKGRGEILVKEAGVIAGLEVASLVFHSVDPELKFKPLVSDGANVEAKTVVGMVEGSLASILTSERTALNFFQRMSGIATLTRQFVDRVKGTRAKITDTRKTAPALRIIDKLAVQIGGGVNHRFGLDDMVLIKDNHIVAAGSIAAAIDRCANSLKGNLSSIKVEIEVKNMEEIKEVLKCTGIHRIMLDNFSVAEIKKAVDAINHVVEVEASGNVNLDNVRNIADAGVDFISIGALTHSPQALDISLEIRKTTSFPA